MKLADFIPRFEALGIVNPDRDSLCCTAVVTDDEQHLFVTFDLGKDAGPWSLGEIDETWKIDTPEEAEKLLAYIPAERARRAEGRKRYAEEVRAAFGEADQ